MLILCTVKYNEDFSVKFLRYGLIAAGPIAKKGKVSRDK